MPWAYDMPGVHLMLSGLPLVQSVLLLAMAAFASRESSVSETVATVGPGLARTSQALLCLAVARAVFAALMVLLGMPHELEMTRYVLLAMAVLAAFELACLLVLALAAISTVRGRSVLPTWLVVASSGVALSVAGNAMGQVGRRLHLIADIYESSLRTWSWAGTYFSLKPEISSHVLSALAICALTIAVAIAARRRGLEELRARAITSTCIVVGLAIASITAQEIVGPIVWPDFQLSPSAASILAAAHAALLAAWLVAARMMRRAAGDLGGTQNIPTAKVVS